MGSTADAILKDIREGKISDPENCTWYKDKAICNILVGELAKEGRDFIKEVNESLQIALDIEKADEQEIFKGLRKNTLKTLYTVLEKGTPKDQLEAIKITKNMVQEFNQKTEVKADIDSTVNLKLSDTELLNNLMFELCNEEED
jgi:hypothetical protein